MDPFTMAGISALGGDDLLGSSSIASPLGGGFTGGSAGPSSAEGGSNDDTFASAFSVNLGSGSLDQAGASIPAYIVLGLVAVGIYALTKGA